MQKDTMKLLVLCLAVLPLVWGGKMMVDVEGMLKDMMGDMGGDKKPDMMSEFKDFLKDQQKPDEGDAMFMQKIKSNIMNFKDYVKAQQFKHMMEKKAEAAAQKKEKLMMMKDLLQDQMEEVAEKLHEKKADFKVHLVHELIGFCKCENSGLDMLMRIQAGNFGRWNVNWTNPSVNWTMPSVNASVGGGAGATACVGGQCISASAGAGGASASGGGISASVNVGGGSASASAGGGGVSVSVGGGGGSVSVDGMAYPRVELFADHFKTCDPKDKLEYAVKGMINMMCGSVRTYLAQLMDLETDLHDYLNVNVTMPARSSTTPVP